MKWLRWANLGVALAAAGIANLAAVLYASLEPETEWGPWTYVGLAWATSALAFAAWLPRPLSTRALALGAAASAAWFTYMLQFAVWNVGGHFLAAVFFAAAAWADWRGTDDGKAVVAAWMAHVLWWPAVAGLLATALYIPFHWATGNPGSGLRSATVALYAIAVWAVCVLAVLGATAARGGMWTRGAAVIAAAALAWVTPERYIDPNVGLLAAAAGFGACSVALGALGARVPASTAVATH